MQSVKRPTEQIGWLNVAKLAQQRLHDGTRLKAQVRARYGRGRGEPLVVDRRLPIRTLRNLPAVLGGELRQTPKLIGVPKALLLLLLAGHTSGDDDARLVHLRLTHILHTPQKLSMYGKTYFGNERTTFVIDPDGKVAQVLRKVKPAEHDGLVLGALDQATPPVV